MKLQDIAFFIVLVVLLILKKPKWILYAGLLCFIISIPLFAFWIFFTAQRLVEYGVVCVLVVAIFGLSQLRKRE